MNIDFDNINIFIKIRINCHAHLRKIDKNLIFIVFLPMTLSSRTCSPIDYYLYKCPILLSRSPRNEHFCPNSVIDRPRLV